MGTIPTKTFWVPFHLGHFGPVPATRFLLWYGIVWYGGRELPFSQPGLPDTGLLDYLLGTDFHHHGLLRSPTVAWREPTTLPSGEAW